MPAKTGDLVRVHYRGTLEDGTQFDSSEGRSPLEFRLGEGSVIDGFDSGVKGLEVGGRITVTIPPERAYGPSNPALVQHTEASAFAEDPWVGGQVEIVAPDGSRLPGEITAVDGEEVVLDFNHPLAGKTLVFEIELVEILPAG